MLLGDTQTLLQQNTKQVIFCADAQSDILFAHNLPKAIPLGVSRISLRSNITRRPRIKLPNILMGSWAKEVAFLLFKFKCACVELIVFAFLCNQIFVVAAFYDFAVFKHHYNVGVFNG